jgi:hypothetical protein
MADDNDNKSGRGATGAILAFSAILAAAPALGLDQAIVRHGASLSENERIVLKSLSPDEVTALANINTQLDQLAVLDNNNNNNNNNKKVVEV